MGAVASGDGLIVPVGLVDEVLQALVGILDAELWRQVDAADHRLDALPFAVLEQAAEIDAAPGALRLVAEIVAEELGVDPEPAEDLGSEFGRMGLVHTIHTNKAPDRFVGFNGVVLGTTRHFSTSAGHNRNCWGLYERHLCRAVRKPFAKLSRRGSEPPGADRAVTIIPDSVTHHT